MYTQLNKIKPFKRMSLIPNVSKFEVIPTRYSLIALLFGVPKVHNEFKATKLIKSDKANRYLKRQYSRLSNYARRGQLKEYLFLASVLIRKSEVFKVCALNRTLRCWYLFDLSKLDRIWRRLQHISRTMSFDLRSKRVWIDKKAGDYARPLGVPSEEWRIYSWMQLEVIERWLYERDMLKPWQHGGRSGRGVKTCITEFIQKINLYDYIYEFDIKGFYDNISQEKITEKIDEIFGANKAGWINKLFAIKPLKYIMPPIEEDKALQRMGMGTRLYADKTYRREVTKFQRRYTLEELEGMPAGSENIGEYVTSYTSEPIDYMTVTYTCKTEDLWDLIEHCKSELVRMKPGYIYDVFIEPRSGEIVEHSTGTQPFIEGYISRMLDKGSWLNMVEPGKPGERETARDQWKGLGQPGKGVPQGLGISPLISTFMTDIHFSAVRGEMLMYMDDGLIFSKTKEGINEALSDVKENLAKLGLELAESKSKLVKEAGEWITGCRFLGLYLDGQKRTMTSMTRSGTVKPLKSVLPMNQEYAMKVAEAVGETVSNVWQTYRSCKELTNYEAGVAYNFLGYLIADAQYKGGLTREEMKFKVQQGKAEKWRIIQECKKAFIWNITRQGPSKGVVPILQTISSVACEQFLRMDKSKIRSAWKSQVFNIPYRRTIDIIRGSAIKGPLTNSKKNKGVPKGPLGK